MLALLTTGYQVAGIILAVPVVIAVVWGIVRGVRHIGTVHEAIIGRPAGPANEAIPSMIERFKEIQEHLGRQDEKIGDIEGYLSNDRSKPFSPNGVRSHK